MMSGRIARCAWIDQAGRCGLQIVQAIAGGKSILRVSRAGGGGAGGATAEIRLDVADGGDGVLVGAVFERPGLFRAVDLAKIINARALLRLEARADKIRDGDGGQEADDGHDNHDLNQRETSRADDFILHTISSFSKPNVSSLVPRSSVFSQTYRD